MQLLHSYQNGNTQVSLFDDGTKIRIFDSAPVSDFPESMDVKITNYCEPVKNNKICGYCHEKSGLHGKHGDLALLLTKLDEMHAGCEIAIGGGNILTHPDLLWFLREVKARQIIPNVTINEKHIEPYQDLILKLIKEDLIKGVGISYSSKEYLKDILPIVRASSNVVFHMIAGINQVSDIDDLNELCLAENRFCKILVLGYKQHGFGINYYVKNPAVESNKYSWYVSIGAQLQKNNLVISFDNLGIKQMNVQRFLTDDAWNSFFQGNDGSHTMYIDAVKQEYAISSTSNSRVAFADMGLREFFKSI